jgi:hypothetical protein
MKAFLKFNIFGTAYRQAANGPNLRLPQGRFEEVMGAIFRILLYSHDTIYIFKLDGRPCHIFLRAMQPQYICLPSSPDP